ncbi:MAG TPA: transglycosylase domain-containing protein, partial [Terriglobia bacterium]|nr:transglycosylase domain-containing protein [Terriglobia bacterium]
MKIKFAPLSQGKLSLKYWVLLIAGGIIAAGFLIFACVFGFYYIKYQKIVDQRLEKPLFENTAKIYAAPQELRPGQKFSAAEVAQQLQDAGYSVDGVGKASLMGTYTLGASSITIHPGPESYHAPDSATVSFSKGVIGEITGDHSQQLAAYQLEPVLITDLSDKNRAKRRLLTYNQIPKVVVQAVTSIEDRRYFEHGGVDYYAIVAWAWHDIRGDRRVMGGASTLTMQLAKEFFLSPERTFKRKFLQIVITFQLEHRFSKQKIFELYANEIPLGQRGSFSINGFGEAAQAYFGEDVGQLTLPQAALLAGLIQSPSRLNPYRHPQRAINRRNVVLDAMVETGDITKEQAEEAKATPLKLAPGAVDAGEAPYFVDLVRDQLASRLGETDYNSEGLRIYTSLDPQLERIATDTVTEGMKHIEEIVDKHHAWRVRHGDKSPIVYPQIALVALNPHTGQVLALVGGRNYGQSQFDHAVSHRPTGSIFKPFVYAAAFNTSLAGAQLTGTDGVSGIFTQSTILNDEPTTFTFDNGQTYSPHDFEDKYYGNVTARTALQWSLNNATISLAQMVGYGNVAALARDAGITSVRATPAMAIGSYDATPLEMAGAYTVFANDGVKIDPWLLASIHSANGDVMDEYTPISKPVLDPRTAYLTTVLMENVINHGTGAGVRSMGFTSPAAGKTGTSHDAWFAGFTSNLICVVWVGNDDYSQLSDSLGAASEGSRAAGPIWADFMKKAVELPQYSDTKPFTPPSGVVEVQLDKNTNLLADAACPDDYTAAFIDGTQPTQTCDNSNGDQRNLFQKLFGIGEKPANSAPASPLPSTTTPAQPQSGNNSAMPSQAPNPAQQPQPEEKKKK